MKIPELKLGDLILTRHPKSLASKFVIFCIRQMDGVKYPFSHVMMVADIRLVYGEEDLPDSPRPHLNVYYLISAEWPRIKLRGVMDFGSHELFAAAERIVIIRPPFTDEERQKIPETARKYAGCRYDVYKYILWFGRFTPVFWPLVYFIGLPFRKWLKKRERKSHDCIEVCATIGEERGVSFGIEDLTFTTPQLPYELSRAAPKEWPLIYDSWDEDLSAKKVSRDVENAILKDVLPIKIETDKE